MKINQMLCPKNLKNNPNKPLKSISYITIHNTGNYAPTATAKNHAVYVSGGSGGTQASFHYAVDKDEIWQMFNDTQACWHAGDGSSDGNMRSIGIEICVNDKSGFRKACENAAWLVAGLMKKHDIPIENVVQHNRWNGKNCPAELRSGVWGVTWENFIGMVKEQNATQPKTSKLYRVQVGAYSQKSNADAMLAKLKAAGFTDVFIRCE